MLFPLPHLLLTVFQAGVMTLSVQAVQMHHHASPVVRAAVVLPVEGVVLRTVAHLEVVQMVVHVPVQRRLLLPLQQLSRSPLLC